MTDNEKKIIDVMDEWGDTWYGMSNLSDEADIDIKECREIIKTLLKKKIIVKVHLVNEHTGKLQGAGYVLL